MVMVIMVHLFCNLCICETNPTPFLNYIHDIMYFMDEVRYSSIISNYLGSTKETFDQWSIVQELSFLVHILSLPLAPY